MNIKQQILNSLSDFGINGILSIIEDSKENKCWLSFICDGDWVEYKESYSLGDDNIIGLFVERVKGYFIGYAKLKIMRQCSIDGDIDCPYVSSKFKDKKVEFSVYGDRFICDVTNHHHVADVVTRIFKDKNTEK